MKNLVEYINEHKKKHLYRPSRATLEESLKETVEVNSLEDIKEQVIKAYEGYTVSDISIDAEEYETRFIGDEDSKAHASVDWGKTQHKVMATVNEGENMCVGWTNFYEAEVEPNVKVEQTE